jgi:predicted metal-dependent hydrolase
MPLAPGATPTRQLSLFDDAPPPAAAPTAFRHPQAQRDIRIGEHLVGYELRRARRRSIGFVVGTEGLTVSAPRWVGITEVEAALREKAAWILRKLHEQRERARRLQAARVDWRDGSVIPFLGRSVVIRLDPRSRGALLDADAAALLLGLPQGAAPAQIRDAVQSWLQRQARRIFEERCQLFAARLGVRLKRLTLSSAATRWGSASGDGSVRLNWRLVHFALPVVDYVVTHELAHLREMNHSAAFWGVVRSVLPEFESARSALRSEVLPVFD